MALVAGLLLGGCTVGPNYRSPAEPVPLPARFGEATIDAAPAPDLSGWWKDYGDPELDRLVSLALAGNPDINAALSRIAGARAAERVTNANSLPQVTGRAGANYQRFSKNAGFASLASLFGGGAQGGGSGASGSGGSGNGGIAAPGGDVTTYSAGFDASWEVDLFGGVQRTNEGARARTEAAVWSARDAQLSLVAEVADAYLALRTLQERERIAREELARQQRNLGIAQNTARAGLLAEGDYVRQRADLASAEAALAPIVAQGKAEMHALGFLAGRTPDALIPELSEPRPPLAIPPAVPPGVPSELLRRRPDVRAAERRLAGATADIGVAVADQFPKISLTGAVQLISTALSNLISTDSLQVSGNAGLQVPLLDFGRRSGAVAVRRAAADEAWFTYQRTVLGALRNVEDALIRLRTDQEQAKSLASGLADAQRGVAAVEARWRTGLTDYGDVLTARRSALAAEDGLATAQGAVRRDVVSLTKALGGGWQDLPLEVPPAGSAAAAYSEPGD